MKKDKAAGIAKQLLILVLGEWMKRKADSPVIGGKQLASYFSYDFQILKVKGLPFTEVEWVY